ncbi:alpha/beta fold hydrolase, partial [Nostoc sp. CHAB 5715]|uniref:alpha/beta fold hydrolase n=1 Tax=Nostoc sp. CHAB 5715 TaxID=2780400 RepID=UPI001E2B98C1
MSQKNIEAIYPLSLSQQGMLFESLSAPESGIHIEQSIWSLQGELDLAAFERAWLRVVGRHSLLRTGFVWKDQDEPIQVVLQRVKVPLEQQDLRGFSLPQQQEKLENYIKMDRIRGFALTKAPLIRLAIFQMDENAHYVVWTFHHIIIDGWSLALILKEFLTFYKAFTKGQDLSLEPSRPYKNYIAWLKQQEQSQAEAFWQKKLQGFKMPTPLATVAAPGSFSAQKKHYGKQKACLPASATEALQFLARQHHLTLNILVQGVWALLLSRYSGESDVIFGATVSGRPPDLAGVESMVGLFINTLPIRLRISAEALLWCWLKDIQVQHLEQRAYEYCSAGQVQQWSEVPASLPLYESILVFENYPVDSSILQSSNLTIDLHKTRSTGAQTKYPLTVLVIPGSELEFHIVYDSDRFYSDDITLILEHFLTLLKSIVAVPEQDLATIISRISTEQIPQVKPLQKHVQRELKEDFIPPRDSLEQQLAQIWSEVLGVHLIGVRDNFFDLGGHSLLAVRLMAQIQQQFRKNLPLAALFQGSTIEQLADILRQQTDSLSWSPLVPIQPNGSKRPFFCLPGAGGNVIYFYDLARYLGLDQPFYGLQSPGLDGESQPYTQIEDMAVHYIEALQTVQPQGPYFLGGHSSGALVAFEMAQQLQKQGHEVALVAILDTEAPIPGRHLIGVDWDDAKWLTRITNLVERFFGKNQEISYEALHSLKPEEQLNYIGERLKTINLLPLEAGIKQIRGLMQVFKANYQASAHYVPQEVYPTRITLFRASEVYLEDT